MTTASAKAVSWKVRLRQRTSRTARWLHLYLSMVSFGVILFFATTGLTVNHPEWFAHAVRTRELRGRVDAATLASANAEAAAAGQQGDSQKASLDDAQKVSLDDALIRAVRGAQHLHGTVHEERRDPDQTSFTFEAPGYTADVSVAVPAGTYTVVETRNGFVAVVNDLHRGHEAGAAWRTLIDLSAVFLVVISLSGLLILWFMQKQRAAGLVVAGSGVLFCFLLYKIFVP